MPLTPLDQLDLGLLRVVLSDGDDPKFNLSSYLLSLSADAAHLAIGRGKRLLIVPLQSAGAPVILHLQTGDSVCSLAWVDHETQSAILVAGFSTGRLSAFTRSGQLLWSAMPHGSRFASLIQLQSSVEHGLLGLHSDGLLTFAPSISQMSSPSGGPSQLWQYSLPPHESKGCHAIVQCGPLPPLPLDLTLPSGFGGDDATAFSPDKLIFVAALDDELQLHTAKPPAAKAVMRTRSSRLVSSGLSALSSWLSGGGAAAESGVESGEEGEGGPTADAPIDWVDTLPLSPGPVPQLQPTRRLGETDLVRAFADAPRQFVVLSLEPRRQRWLAATDSLGRVTVFEPKSLVATRIFKGYRDAQLGWTDAASANVDALKTAALLVIYAPRRGLLEVWRVPSGGRLFACSVGPDCVLLMPPMLPPSPSRTAADVEALDLSTSAPRCFLLQPSGLLHVVRSHE